MNRLLIGLAFIAFLSVLGVATPVAAQSVPPRLAQWDVQVWPEYDQPAVLVIISGSLTDDSGLPQELAIPIPAGAAVHAVAYPDDTGNLLTLPWTAEAAGQAQIIRFTLDQPRFVVEYYADVLSPPPSRRFGLDLAAPYDANQATVLLRQPARASGLVTEPAMLPAGLDALGNPTYTLDLGSLRAGQAAPLQVSYTKADNLPSVSSPAPPASGSADNGLPWLSVLIGLAAGVLIGAALLYLLLKRRPVAASRQARRRNERKKASQAERPAAGRAAGAGVVSQFCVQCGQKFAGDDKFCRNCGAPRR